MMREALKILVRVEISREKFTDLENNHYLRT